MLAEATDGFSGADLAGLVRAAAAFALERYVGLQGLTEVDIAKPRKAPADASAAMLEVRAGDFADALREAAKGATGGLRRSSVFSWWRQRRFSRRLNAFSR